MRALYLILLAISLLSPVRSFADSATQEKLSKDLLGSWLVTVAYEGRTRLLKITEVSQGSDGVYPLTAVYGWSDGNQTPIKAEFQDSAIKKLTVVTQADSVITASQDSSTTYIGTFTPKNGASKGLRIAKISETELARLNAPPPIEKVAADVPASCAPFIGGWTGDWGNGQRWLWVTEIDVGCNAKYSYSPRTKEFKRAEIRNGVLSFPCGTTGGTCFLEQHGDELWGRYSGPDGTATSVFKKSS